MFSIKSVNFENLIVCLAENYISNDNVITNNTELSRFSDPLYYDGKEVLILTVEDEDLDDTIAMIDDRDPVHEWDHASFMHRIAVEEVMKVTKNSIADLFNGQFTAGESLLEFYDEPEPAYPSGVWTHAVSEVKSKIRKVLDLPEFYF